MATSRSIKIEYGPVHRLVSRHGANARVEVSYDNSFKSGFIKAIQRNAITKRIIHVDIQLVSKDQEVRLGIPLLFDNEEQLTGRQLQLLVYKPMVEVEGTVASIPAAIRIDVGALEAGGAITVGTIEQGYKLKVSDKEDTLYAAVIHQPAAELPEEALQQESEEAGNE